MDELQVPQTALVRFLQPLQLAIEKIEPFDIPNYRWLAPSMRFLQIGCAKGSAHAMMSNQLIHPGEPVEMMTVEFARCGCAHHREGTFGTAAEHRHVRDVGKTRHRQGSRAHCIREVAARRRFRRDAGPAAMRVHVDRNRSAKHIQCGRRALGGSGGGGRARWSCLASKHRLDRGQGRAPHPGSVHRTM
jgi:hypothetical protein